MATTTRSARGTKLVVVGAGQIGTPLVECLARAGAVVHWVSRHAPAVVPEGVTHHALDACDARALGAVAQGATALMAAVNPGTYDAKVWAATLPPLHAALVEAASQADTRLVLLDSLYLYTLEAGPLAPSTPAEPATKKGEIRRAAHGLVRAAQAEGRLRAVVLRASDFWGAGLARALLTDQSVRALGRGKRPLVLGDPDQLHAFSHRDDVVDALITLALAPADVEGQVFHAPVLHVSPRALITAFAEAQGVDVKPFRAPRWLVRLVGLFDPNVRGLIEMLPQWERAYRVDDSGYVARFGKPAKSLASGVAEALGRRVADPAGVAAAARACG